MSDLPVILSLGAGVQSSTLALLAKHRVVGPMPMCAIFADTQAEPAAVYKHLDWLETVLPFPVHRVTAGNLYEVIGKPRDVGKRVPHMPIPAYTATRDGRSTPLHRECTEDFKIIPIRRQIRAMFGLTRKRGPRTPIVEQWIGISRDEAHRMKPSRQAWMRNRWPLVDMSMTRGDCLRWLSENGYPWPPKSSCTFCPFHDDAQWKATKADPAAWAQAVAVDEKIRNLNRVSSTAPLYLHRSMVPLAEVVFKDEPEKLQGDLFGNECEGMCGV